MDRGEEGRRENRGEGSEEVMEDEGKTGKRGEGMRRKGQRVEEGRNREETVIM